MRAHICYVTLHSAIAEAKAGIRLSLQRCLHAKQKEGPQVRCVVWRSDVHATIISVCSGLYPRFTDEFAKFLPDAISSIVKTASAEGDNKVSQAVSRFAWDVISTAFDDFWSLDHVVSAVRL